MSPEEFVTRMLAHYSKRHESEEARKFWFEDIVGIVKPHSGDVLRKAYEIIRDTHEERAFPLPATIRKAIGAACEAIAPASTPLSPELEAKFRRIAAERRERPTSEEVANEEAARKWRENELAKRVADADVRINFKPFDHTDILGPVFSRMQEQSPNKSLHMTKAGLTERSKAMSGDREDAA